LRRVRLTPFRFSINLLSDPDQFHGDVVTGDGEILGRWVIRGTRRLSS
jgi:hypothetical protein